MTDIPSLIERLGAWSRDQEGTAIAEDLTEAAAELSRLTVSPLPGEIAGLIEDVRFKERLNRTQIAAALQRLAEEVERLHERLEDNHLFEHRDGQMVRVEVPPGSIPDGIDCRDETIKLQDERNDRQAARITELEADLKQHQSLNAAEHEILLQVSAERDAIKAKTISDCLNTTITIRGLGTVSDDYLNGFHDGATAKTDSIRALNQEADGGERGE